MGDKHAKIGSNRTEKLREMMYAEEGTARLCARMGCLFVYSKRYRKVDLLSHGVRLWNGETHKVLQEVIDKNNKMDIENWDEWLENEIDDDIETTSRTIAKSVSSKGLSDWEYIM